ncbi:MAG TPA: ParB/RepB/Spo0J family partition protein [Clostridiaceae bacterium]|nr:ParB/RepB/Spo0J family partition protein [Clostridiaceae bacterium]
MKEQKQDMKLPKLDDLFTTQEERDYAVAEKVQEIDISKISNFPDHPFKVNDDEKMQDMVKSIKEYGVILPVIVRPKEDGTYEMISGHRRKRACELAGVKQIRCIVKNLSDDEATILMVDSNIQREEILPSEKAFAYKMKLEAMKHQGKNIDIDDNETSRPLDGKLESAEIMGQEVGESARTIQRYIRLTKLIPELLDEVDSKRIAFRPAVELSYLSDENQYVVLNKLEFDEVSPSLSQAIILKKMEQEGTITEEKIEELLDKEKPNQKEFIKIHNEKIDRYIPTKIKETGNVEDFIILCVQEHNKRERLKQERDAR